MTRETKIGLLVGLAFVIVIGILLSDHITRSMQPPQAALLEAGNSVRGGVTAPGTGHVGYAPDVQVGRVQPNRPVVTNEQPRRADVSVGPGGPRITAPRDTARNPVGNIIGNLVAADNVLHSETPESRETTGPGPAPGPNDNMLQPAPSTKQYTARAGDTLRKIARKEMGEDTQANRDAIVAANPSLKRDPSKIIAGHTYVIPVPEAAKSEETASGSTPPTPVTPPAGTEVVYTTKTGDSLWKIAMEQVGSGSAVGQIREMNKDVLKNGDSIKPNMKLKLPAKQVASAN